MGMTQLKDLPGVSPSVLKRVIKIMVKKMRRVVMIWSPPGCAKSACVAQAAEELCDDKEQWDVVDVRAALLNPVDIRGIPVADLTKRVADWFPPGFLPQDGKRKDGKVQRGILFLDEINSAPQAVQAALYQLLYDYAVGEYVLPKGWSIVCAGNRSEDRALTFEMPSALRTRMFHIDLRPDIDEFAKHGTKMGFAKEVIAFIRHLGEKHLFSYDHTVHKRGFPCPRSWEFVSDIFTKGGLDPLAKTSDGEDDVAEQMIVRNLVEGAVGPVTTQEFMAFVQLFKELPSVEEILKGNMKVDCPDRNDRMYAFSSALVSGVYQIKDKSERIGAAKNLLKYMNTKFKADFAVKTFLDLVEAPNYKEVAAKIESSPELDTFSDKFQHLM